jgi:hypothetical protein
LVANVKEKTMASKKFWLGILVMVLVFGMVVVGCVDDEPYDVTITFDANGGKWDDNSTTKTVTVKAESGSGYTGDIKLLVSEPTWQGKTFDGWAPYANPDPNTVYSFDIHEDTTVYARWR